MSKVLTILERRRKLLKKKPKRDPLRPPKIQLPFQKQTIFIDSVAQFISAQCTRRAGKTSALALRFKKTMDRHPGSVCFYLSLTFDSAKSIMWPVLQELNDDLGWGCQFREGKMIMIAPNGATLRLYGADQKNFVKRLKGQKSPGIAIDEAQDFGSHLQSLVDDILTPMMVDYQDSWLALTGTPGPVPIGYFFDVTKNKKYGFETHEWSINENPYIVDPEAFIQKQIKKNGWLPNNPTLLREWRNVWVLDLEALWIKYEAEKCQFEELPKNVKNWNYICAIDLGFIHSDAIAVLAWSEEDPNIYLVEEIITAKQGLTPLANQIKDVMKRYNVHKLPIDTGGGGAKMAEELRMQFRIPVEAADKKEKQQTVEFMNDTLRLGKFKARKNSRFVHDSYLVQIDWEKSTPDKIVIQEKPHSDIIDAVIYGYKCSPFYTYEEKKKTTKPGTKEHEEEQAQILYEHHVQQLEKARAQKEGEPTWTNDDQGIPPWLKYDE